MPRAAVGGKRIVEGKGRKANTSARGDRRKDHRAEDGGRDLGTGGGEAFICGADPGVRRSWRERGGKTCERGGQLG